MDKSSIYLYMFLGAGIILIICCLVSAIRRWRSREVPLLIDELEGHDFEYYCADLLRGCGYQNVRVTPGSGDFGVDILAEKDGITYGVQCKRYDRPIGVFAIQQVYAGKDFYHLMAGAVMTNQTFTPAAHTMAERLNVLLWDREVIRGVDISLYGLLSKLTTATSPGTDRPFFVR